MAVENTGYNSLFSSTQTDLTNIYDTSYCVTVGGVENTGYLSELVPYNGKDLGTIFTLYKGLATKNLSGTQGTPCGYSTPIGVDIGTLFCLKGTITSAAPAAPSYYPLKSLQFTYSSNMFATSANAAYYTHSSLSIEAWVKIPPGTLQGGTTTGSTNLSNYGVIVLKQAWCAILVDRTNNLKVFNQNSDVYPNGVTNLNVGDGNWHHVAVSLTPGTNTSAIYIDGVKKQNFTWTTYTNTPDLFIGNNPYNNNSSYRTPLVGKISFVRFWKTNLSDVFIASNYNKHYRNYGLLWKQ